MSHQILSTLPPKSRLNPLTPSHPHCFVSPLEHSGFAFELMKQPPNWSAKNGSRRPLISLSSPTPGLAPSVLQGTLHTCPPQPSGTCLNSHFYSDDYTTTACL